MPSLFSFLFPPIPSIPSLSLPSLRSLPSLLPLPFHSPTRRAATRLRLDWTEAGPTLPHSTLVHVQVTECSTATDTHAAGAQDGSQSTLTAGPNPTHVDPTHHTNTSGLLQCTLTRGAQVQDSTTVVMSRWQRGQREQLQTQFNSSLNSAFYNTAGLLSIDPLPRPSASTTRCFPTAQLPEGLLTRWSRVELWRPLLKQLRGHEPVALDLGLGWRKQQTSHTRDLQYC